MGTMNFTKINFTLLELFHLVSRVELQNDIVYIKFAEEQEVVFPRNKLNKAKLNTHKLPTDEEISKIISNAKKAALDDTLKCGMKITAEDIEECEA